VTTTACGGSFEDGIDEHATVTQAVTTWTDLGGSTGHRVTVTSSGNGRFFDAFIRAAGGSVQHKAATAAGYIPSQLGWANLGGYSQSSPAAVSRAPGLLDVFIRDPRQPNPGIYTKAWNGMAWLPSPSDWWYLEGAGVDEPTVVSWGPDRLDVFGRGVNGDVMHKYWNGTWSAWESLGGVISHPVTAVSRGTGKIDLFVRGVDGAVHQNSFPGNGPLGWTGWIYHGGSVIGAPTAIVWGPNHLDILARATDNSVWARYSIETWWSSWTSLGGSTVTPIAAVPGGADATDNLAFIVAQNSANVLVEEALPGIGGGWENLGGATGWTVSANRYDSNRVDVFLRKSDGKVLHTVWPDERSGIRHACQMRRQKCKSKQQFSNVRSVYPRTVRTGLENAMFGSAGCCPSHHGWSCCWRLVVEHPSPRFQRPRRST
jgi:hypothetical protein